MPTDRELYDEPALGAQLTTHLQHARPAWARLVEREGQPVTIAIAIAEADLDDAAHAAAIVELIDGYARGPGGQNAPLESAARGAMVAGLRAHPKMTVYLAWRGGAAVGVAVCIEGFSTFAGRPTVNIHDLAVADAHQGRGVGGALIDRVVADARTRGCCKVTLEVHDTNANAKRLYEWKGFGPWEPATLFVSKPLSGKPL